MGWSCGCCGCDGAAREAFTDILEKRKSSSLSGGVSTDGATESAASGGVGESVLDSAD